LKQSWQRICSKFEALNQRERWMVFCALLVVVYAVINMLLLSPVLARKKTLTEELTADQSQIQALSQQISALSQKSVVDPDAQSKQRIAELQTHLLKLEHQLSSLHNTLVSPSKMPELLRSLLKKNGTLKLIELKTLPTSGLLDNVSDGAIAGTTAGEVLTQTKQPLSGVFKHGVEITIEGRYLDLLEYTAELEKMPWHVLWSKAALSADYPNSQLKLTVYTLSLDQTWLSI
jgi:MSHA biogenesis protein MshJ